VVEVYSVAQAAGPVMNRVWNYSKTAQRSRRSANEHVCQ